MTKKEIKIQLTRRKQRYILLKNSIKDCDRLYKKFKLKDYLNLKKMYQKDLEKLENERHI